ncbi:MAG: hypothetical protein WDO56_24760 [Gammaproteobacteria bacterium]
MILALEVPHSGQASCWFAFDEADFIRKVRLARPAADGVIFHIDTPRRLLVARGALPDSPGVHEHHADILELAATHGWDAPLYRADYLLAPGHFQAEEVPEFVAHVAALAHGLHSCRVYPDEEDALDALHADPLYAGREGFHAHMALREQLIALEVLSDDL